jgi:AraC-like DNA-binding protein
MLSSRKPALEKVSTGFESSFSIKYYDDPSPQEYPPFWHFHPEIELVFIKGGSGKRHIGNHLSYYQSGDLVLIGSMLPHAGFTNRLTGNESETVIQFNNDCFGSAFFDLDEMQDIRQLLERAKSGIAFQGKAKQEIGAKIEKLVKMDKFSKLIGLLRILQDMAWTEEYAILNADGYTFEVESTDNDRINVVYSYVKTHFQRPIPLDEISDIANMTSPSFCRYFKRVSGKKFTRFVNEIRIVHACKLLTEQQLSISDIAFESGFNNFSHFNRLFKDITKKSPSAYRKQFVKILTDVT